MAWQKLIVSGSIAQLQGLQLDTPLAPLYGGLGLNAASLSAFPVGTGVNGYALVGSNGLGRVVRELGAIGVIMSGSFSGSFIGNGSGLTGISSAPTFGLSGSTGGVSFEASTDTLAFTTASAQGFDMSMSFSGTRKTVWLIAPQDLRSGARVSFGHLAVTQSITGSTLQLTGLVAGATNEVMIITGGNTVATRSIDARVWGTSLIDGAGANTRVAYFSDADTLTSNAAFTYNGTVLGVGSSTFGTDVIIAGDLTVLGNVIQLQITNLNVEDRFIYLNSGSSTGDGGLVVGSGSLGNGVAFGFDESTARWAIQQSTLLTLSSSTLSPEAYMAAAIDVDGGQTILNYHARNGNIMVSGSDIWIYA